MVQTIATFPVTNGKHTVFTAAAYIRINDDGTVEYWATGIEYVNAEEHGILHRPVSERMFTASDAIRRAARYAGWDKL